MIDQEEFMSSSSSVAFYFGQDSRSTAIIGWRLWTVGIFVWFLVMIIHES